MKGKQLVVWLCLLALTTGCRKPPQQPLSTATPTAVPTTTATAAPAATPTTQPAHSYLDGVDLSNAIDMPSAPMDLAVNIYDSAVREKGSDYIIIGTVLSLDGAVNYNPVEKVGTSILTIGQIRVDKVIKGDLPQQVIPFVRLGGTMCLAEYEKGLTDSERQAYSYLASLTDQEKRNTYTTSINFDDIVIEAGKTYLMYMLYDSDYARYGLGYMDGGLREVDTATLPTGATLTAQQQQTILCKNNITGVYEPLSTTLSE